MNGTSTMAVSVAEAKKSRSVSISRTVPASAPVDPRLRSSRIVSSLTKIASPTLAVDPGAGDVDEIGAQCLEREIEQDDDAQADGQSDQRGRGVVGDDAVIDPPS